MWLSKVIAAPGEVRESAVAKVDRYPVQWPLSCAVALPFTLALLPGPGRASMAEPAILAELLFAAGAGTQSQGGYCDEPWIPSPFWAWSRRRPAMRSRRSSHGPKQEPRDPRARAKVG
eukprot:s44_g34.t1